MDTVAKFLKIARAVRTQVVEIRGVIPGCVDGCVVVESALPKHEI